MDIEHVEEDWRADVLAVRGPQRVAFEVQWSRQTLAQTLVRQARYRRAGVRGCWFFRYPPPELRRDAGSALAARQDLPLFALEAERGRNTYQVRIDSHTFALAEVVAALLGRRIAFRTHRTFQGATHLPLVFSRKDCPHCGRPCTLYSLGREQETPLQAPCGARVLLWASILYHPDVAQAARRAVQTDRPPTDAPLVTVDPGRGFRCPACHAPLVPAPPVGGDATAHPAVVTVTLTQPLADPQPHWCYGRDGVFCRAVE